MRDKLTHGRKTIASLDLSYGETLTTPCGKRRRRALTSTRSGQVTCPDCRKWFATEERELAESARLAARLADSSSLMASGGRFYSGHADGSPYTADDFRELAVQHERRAAEWSN